MDAGTVINMLLFFLLGLVTASSTSIKTWKFWATLVIAIAIAINAQSNLH